MLVLTCPRCGNSLVVSLDFKVLNILNDPVFVDSLFHSKSNDREGMKQESSSNSGLMKQISCS